MWYGLGWPCSLFEGTEPRMSWQLPRVHVFTVCTVLSRSMWCSGCSRVGAQPPRQHFLDACAGRATQFEQISLGNAPSCFRTFSR